MTFTNPLALLWGLLAVPVVLLYWRRIRLRRETVATGMFWERVFAEDRARQSWQRWRHGVSLAVQLAVLLLLVLALAEPLIPPPRQTVIVLDNSASMSAADVAPSRLARAKEAAAQIVGGLRECDRAAVLAAGDAVGVGCGLSANRELLLAAIEQVPATQGASRVEDAVRVARTMLAGTPRARIIVLSDGGFSGAETLAEADDVELVRVGTAADNLAVSRLVARRSLAEPAKCEVLAEVTGFAARPVEAQLDVRYDDRPLDSRAIRVPGDGRWQQVFELSTPGGGRLAARVGPKGAYPADNEKAVGIPRGGVRRVMLGGENSFVEAALRANAGVELSAAGGPADGKGDSVAVFVGQVPERLPDGPTIVVGPLGPCDLWKLGEPLSDAVVAGQDWQSPVTAEVALVGTALPGARSVELSDDARPLARSLAWNTEQAPLIVAIERPGGRVVVFASPLDSGLLPLSSAFPVLMAKAVDWVADTDDDKPVGSGAIEAGEARLFDERPEGDLRMPGDVGVDVEQFSVSGPGVPPWLVLVLLAAVLFAAEWCLYQRRWLT